MSKFLANIYFNIEKFFVDRGFSFDQYANSLHLYGSFMLMILLVAVLGMNLWLSAGIVLAVGIIKELIDKYIRHTEFSWMDIVFDFLGIVVGIVFCTGVKP